MLSHKTLSKVLAALQSGTFAVGTDYGQFAAGNPEIVDYAAYQRVLVAYHQKTDRLVATENEN